MKVALIVIYNHKFDKNIALIEKIYEKRFSIIYHIVPFYTGNQPNVIPVYENSIYFEGYVAQGLKSFYCPDITHYFFIADDLVIHPDINENNYFEYFHLTETKSFITNFLNLYKSLFWAHTFDAFAFQLTKRYVEVKNEFPDYKDAENLLLKSGAIQQPLKYEKPVIGKHLYGYLRQNLFNKRTWKRFFQWLYVIVFRKGYTLSYPLTASYSDIFIVSGKSIKPFCHYCGIFAALELHVEVAIPTALGLSSDEKIVTESDLPIKGKPLWPNEGMKEFLSPYRNNLDILMKNYPEVLYIHPIKLSQWDCSFVS
jgi:hypothetical protein